jgi:hypothetical protein
MKRRKPEVGLRGPLDCRLQPVPQTPGVRGVENPPSGWLGWVYFTILLDTPNRGVACCNYPIVMGY